MIFPPPGSIVPGDCDVHSPKNDDNGLYPSFIYSIKSQSDQHRNDITCEILRGATINYLCSRRHKLVGDFTLALAFLATPIGMRSEEVLCFKNDGILTLFPSI